MTTRLALGALMLLASCHGRCSPGAAVTPEGPSAQPPVPLWDQPPPLEGAALTQVVELTSSHQEFCARRADGSVVCWGNRSSSNAPRSPFTVGVRLAGPAVALSMAEGGACATLHDGSLWCWSGGGQGTPEPDQRTPQQVAGFDVTGPVAVSQLGVCAATGAPTRVLCQGWLMEDYLRRYSGDAPEEIYYRVGTSYAYTPGPDQPPILISDSELPPWWPNGPPIEQVQGIQQLEAPIPNYFCIRTEHAVRCFTRDEVPVPQEVQGWRHVSGGGSFLCGVDATGRVGAWYPLADHPVRYVEGVRDAVAVDCMDHGCLIHADRTVSCFGFERFVRPTRYPAPLQPFQPARIEGVAGVLQVAAGEGAACALLDDQTVLCWGRNNGSLGIGAPLPSGDDVPVYPPRRVRAPR